MPRMRGYQTVLKLREAVMSWMPLERKILLGYKLKLSLLVKFPFGLMSFCKVEDFLRKVVSLVKFAWVDGPVAQPQGIPDFTDLNFFSLGVISRGNIGGKWRPPKQRTSSEIFRQLHYFHWETLPRGKWFLKWLKVNTTLSAIAQQLIRWQQVTKCCWQHIITCKRLFS